MMDRLYGAVGVIIFLGLALFVAWYLTGPTLTPADMEQMTEQAKTNAADLQAIDQATVQDQKHPSNVALPPITNPLSDQEYTWRQLLNRDSIAPIYNPIFVSADEALFEDQELVIGVVINDEAKAYPIGPLNAREMVNDVLGGIPILVTW